MGGEGWEKDERGRERGGKREKDRKTGEEEEEPVGA